MSSFALLTAIAGLASAGLYLAAMAGTPGAAMLSNLAPLPLFMSGLGLAPLAAGLATLIAAAVVALMPLMIDAEGTSRSSEGLIFLALTGAAPYLLSRWALLNRTTAEGSTEWYPPGLLLVRLCGIAAVLVLGAAVLFAGHEGGLIGAVRTALEGFAGRIQETPDNQALITALRRVIPGLAPAMPAILAVVWLTFMVINGVLGQALLVRSRHNLRPSPDFRRLDLPAGLAWFTGATLIASWLPGNIGAVAMALAVIGLFAYFLLGLSVVHAFAARSPGRIGLLALFYLALVMLAWPAILIAILGLVQQWTGLRERLGPSAGG